MRQYSKLAVTAAAVAVATLLAACGGSSDSSEVTETAPEETTEQTEAAEATEGDGTISLDGGGKTISVFMPSTSNNYLAEWRRGLEATAADLNFAVTVVENNFDQSEMDLQIQQALAAGDTPDIYVFWPADSKAGVASLRALSQTGVPVVVANQPPPAEAAEFVTMYAGVNDYLNGFVAGELLNGAREAAETAGKKFSSPGGNLLEIRFTPGYQASVARTEGFDEATSAIPFNKIAMEYSGFDAEAGYNTTSQLIAANKAQGIDFLYAHNDALAAGAVKALEEAGLVPGKDVYVVGGTCHGDLSALESGKQYGSGLQAARLEGNVVTLSVARYFANDGKVVEGEDSPEASETFPTTTEPPFQFNYIPNPGLVFSSDAAANKALLDNTILWGDTMRNLCTY
jgi:ABC-type sugar transport system substrate-binding protein